jgi:lactoylglutathione lyase
MRAFPVLYANDVQAAAAFWERLGFERRYAFPEGDAPGYISLTRQGCDIAVTAAEWLTDQYGLRMGDAPRVEMFVYVEDVDALVRELRDEGVPVLREPADMPWGERIATMQDPDGNPVSLANG